MKLKEFLEMMNENVSVHVAIQVEGVDNCLSKELSLQIIK